MIAKDFHYFGEQINTAEMRSVFITNKTNSVSNVKFF